MKLLSIHLFIISTTKQTFQMKQNDKIKVIYNNISKYSKTNIPHEGTHDGTTETAKSEGDGEGSKEHRFQENHP